MDRYYAYILLILGVFWLLLSGHYTPLLLSLGGGSVAVVVWFMWRIDRIDGEPFVIHVTLRVIGYSFWLFKEVVKANIDVASRIWDPNMPLAPVWVRLDTTVSTPLEKTTYANSITLTPGTLTTDVEDDHFMVHSLSEEGIEDLRRGEMERRVRKLGI
ncbi:MAG: Na+/H+ antiporter subunit E [Magnetococcales bacterium]|nr:Na+/H+ antiporter subunit E [Magnetococcales bacterium]